MTQYLVLCGPEHDGHGATWFTASSYRDALDVTEKVAEGPVFHHPLYGLSVEGWLTPDLDTAKEIAKKAVAAIYVVDPAI